MSHVRSFFRPLAVALTLTFLAAPTIAFADQGFGAQGAARRPGAPNVNQDFEQTGTKVDVKEKHKHFPMAADKFEKHVDKRLEKARQKLEKRLGDRNIPEQKRAEMRKVFDEHASQIRAAAKRAGADGTVTAEEAKEVREVGRSLRQKAKEKHKEHKGNKKDKKAA